MAENNSSAPLKTAEGAYPALPKPAYPAQFNGHGGEQSSDEGYSAEQMRAYAAQAVAAQAPTAVADEMSPEFTDTARAALMWVLWHHQGSSSEIGTAMRFSLGMGKFDRLNDHQLSEAKRWAEIKGVTKAASTGVAAPSKHLALQWCAGALQEMANERDTVRMAGLGESLTIGEILDMADMALATPALPATEDSSAGDLAEVQVADAMSREERMIVLQRNADGTPTVWCDPEIADIVRALNSGGVKTLASCSGHGEKPGGIALADGRQLLLLESLEAFTSALDAISGEAEVQAEPVAWLLEGCGVVEFERKSYHSGYEWTPLYTAPQAQPADALDAKRWRDHIGKLDALVTYCPTCCQGFTAKPEMTRDEVIFECGKTAGRSAAMTKEGK